MTNGSPDNRPDLARLDEAPDPNGETQVLDSPAPPEPTRASPPPPWWHLLVDRNPLFLLSGISMFAGCYAASRAIHADPDHPEALPLLLGLLAVLNLYELMVIGLGLLLSRSATLVRDTRHLLGLALLLMVDVGFIYHESATASLPVGVMIGGAATLLGLCKAVLITRGLGVRLRPMVTGLVGLDLAAVYFLPVVMRWIAGDGFVSPGAMLGVFCVMGLLIALHALPLRWGTIQADPRNDYLQLQQLVRGGVVLLPALSAIAHVAVGPWVYGTGYTGAYLAPLLLGLAVVMGRQLAVAGDANTASRSAVVLTAAAVASTLRSPDTMIALIDAPLDVYASPLRGALLLSAAVIAWLGWRHRQWRYPMVSVVLLGLAMLGHTAHAMLQRTERLARETWELLRGIIPDSQLEWGVFGVGFAFLLLACGAAVSLWQHRRQNRPLPHPPGTA